MYYFWWGCRGNLTLITYILQPNLDPVARLASSRIKSNFPRSATDSIPAPYTLQCLQQDERSSTVYLRLVSWDFPTHSGTAPYTLQRLQQDKRSSTVYRRLVSWDFPTHSGTAPYTLQRLQQDKRSSTVYRRLVSWDFPTHSGTAPYTLQRLQQDERSIPVYLRLVDRVLTAPRETALISRISYFRVKKFNRRIMGD